jgi:hypothetical protein
MIIASRDKPTVPLTAGKVRKRSKRAEITLTLTQN